MFKLRSLELITEMIIHMLDPINQLKAELSTRKPLSYSRYIPTRYPYTYACDFVRRNQEIVPRRVRAHYGFILELESRGDARQVIKTWARMFQVADEQLCCVLADRYLVEEGIERE